MGAEQATTLIQRKAQTGSDAHAARAVSLARALRLTAAKQAENIMGLAVAALGITRTTRSAKGVVGYLDADWLTLLMDGPAGQVAAVLLEPELASGLIQQQTTGKVTPAAEAAEKRPHTQTDAALCAPFVEALMAQSARLPEAAGDRDLIQGYRYGVYAPEPRHAELVLDAVSFEVIEMTLDLAAGVRSGRMILILPEKASTSVTADVSTGVLKPPHKESDLTQNVLALHVDLKIALTLLKLPLKQVTSLKAGDVVDLNISKMTGALVIDTGGRVVSRGTLGQIDGMRALQVQHKSAGDILTPHRRAADRADLDLPDVTAGAQGLLFDRRAEDAIAPATLDLNQPAQMDIPAMADVDIFGGADSLPDLPDLPDVDLAEQAADDHMQEMLAQEGEDMDAEDYLSNTR